MEILKLTSIRLSKDVLSKASALGKAHGYFQLSQVLRIAIWVGLKVLRAGILPTLSHMMWEEEELGASHKLEDVLRAAGYEL